RAPHTLSLHDALPILRQEMKLDPALLIASVTLARGASLDRVEAVLDREVEALRKTPPPKSELARARQQVRAWARYEQDGVTFQGDRKSTRLNSSHVSI